ncbi:hypothetical protein F0L68_41155 [Solihabitans fulvus]|uniref:Uncharacterized protein n=1 Tax=Solihabitans fulvus TaxID=1892852 RepID=A0A5B2W3H4_9PSEU|nr:hypothetical protein [Solihabitans fulvus]KAA2245895.1 hypothetical protein F0L68_41155 [Solihabitans fulvus]
MSDEGDHPAMNPTDADMEAYLKAEFTALRDAIDKRDGEAAKRVLEHLAAEGGQDLADRVIEQLLDHGLRRLFGDEGR